jgi:hypothetical protein
MEKEKYEPLIKEARDHFSAIDYKAHIEKRQGFDYLKGTFAFKTLYDFAPESDVEFAISRPYPEASSFEVTSIIHLRRGLNVVTKEFWLPVMDFRFKSIAVPTSRDINDSKIRCFVKNMAFNFNLGLEVYNGGDFHPNEDEESLISAEQSGIVYQMIEDTDSDIEKFCLAFKVTCIEELTKGSYERAVQILQKKMEAKDA